LGLSLKSLLPVAGAAAGFFLGGPAGSAAVNAALGSGIGTLLAGGDIKDAVKNAAMAGIAGAGLGAAGVQGAGATSTAAQQAATQAGTAATAGQVSEAALYDAAMSTPAAATKAASTGIMSGLPKSALAYGALGLAGAALAEEPEELELTELQKAQLETRETNPYYQGQAIVQPYDYGVRYAANGGYIEGPGTGRSDSVRSGIYQNGQKVQEARLSDGEFVMTERAVRGLGNGNRSQGAARMYDMMRQYERMA